MHKHTDSWTDFDDNIYVAVWTSIIIIIIIINGDHELVIFSDE